MSGLRACVAYVWEWLFGFPEPEGRVIPGFRPHGVRPGRGPQRPEL